MHINVKPPKGRIFLEPNDAVADIISRQLWSKGWDAGGASFGRTMAERKAIDDAIKAKDYSAFKASQRRGYWRVELNK